MSTFITRGALRAEQQTETAVNVAVQGTVPVATPATLVKASYNSRSGAWSVNPATLLSLTIVALSADVKIDLKEGGGSVAIPNGGSWSFSLGAGEQLSVTGNAQWAVTGTTYTTLHTWRV